MSLDPPPAPPEAAPDADAIRRRDAVPLWVVVLLAFFFVVRLYDVGVAPFLTPMASVKASGVDDASMQDLLETDIDAKTAFISTMGGAGNAGKPDRDTLRQALRAAERLQRESGNSPGAARRVILLRALQQYAAPSQAPLSPFMPRRNKPDPLAAFGSALPAGLPPAERARYAQEARLWQTVFQGGLLTSRQTADAAAQIRRLPNIRWWQYPALIALYSGQGDLSEANRYAAQARSQALPSLIPFSLLSLVRLGLILVGVLLLVYFGLRWRQNKAAILGKLGPNGEVLDLWPTIPAPISFTQRRLGVGDLLGVFLLYLVSREVLSALLSGFDAPILRHFHGLIAPFMPAINRMTPENRELTGILLESAVYLLSAVPPFVLLRTLARRRGASLADEIGWTRRRLRMNLLYGIGGFSVASALMLPVIWIGQWLFRHAPDPSNPVIPQLIGTSGFWGPFLLLLLASVAAPIVEEVLFRGVFYNAAKMRLGVWPAIVLTGFVFGFVHPVGIAEMLAIGTLGGVFAWMAETRKSLAPSMFAHFLQNFTTTVLLLSVLSG